MNFVTLGQFLTDAEIERCWALWTHRTDERFSVVVAREIITPNLARINAALGQENDARYLAYAIEHVLRQSAEAPLVPSPSPLLPRRD